MQDETQGACLTHRKLSFEMPAPAEVVFDAFHYHQWRAQWDSLVAQTQVQGGAACPSVGALSENGGAGWLRGITMTTRFVSYEPPRLAAAVMVGTGFPFARWAASMRHVDRGDGQSLLIYTYTFSVARSPWGWLLAPVVRAMFLRATRKRFGRLATFLRDHAGEVRAWQLAHKRSSHIGGAAPSG